MAQGLAKTTVSLLGFTSLRVRLAFTPKYGAPLLFFSNISVFPSVSSLFYLFPYIYLHVRFIGKSTLQFSIYRKSIEEEAAGIGYSFTFFIIHFNRDLISGRKLYRIGFE